VLCLPAAPHAPQAAAVVNVASNYSGHLNGWSGDVIIRRIDGQEIRADNDDVILTEAGLLLTLPDGRKAFVPGGAVLYMVEAGPPEAGSDA
jgi:hypothetical protein